MKMIYISQGNIPSKWAHTFQAMKMAEAFSKAVSDFRLLTQGHWSVFLRRRFDYESWYGIQHPFRIVRLPGWRMAHNTVIEGFRYPWFDRAAVRYAAGKKSDLIFTRSPYAGQLCVQSGLNTVIESHLEIDHPEFGRIQAVKNSPFLFAIVTISEELKKLYIQAGIPETKIYVWPDAVNCNAFSRHEDKNYLRVRLNLSQEAFIATYCGHLYKDRGIEDILQCAAALPHVQFMILGGWENDLEQRCAEAHDIRNVIFKGFVPNRYVPEYLMASDVLLMPYSPSCKTAAWMSPMKLFEYMATMRPIIATDLPALHNHLEHERNALLVQPGDPDQLVKAINRILADPSYGYRLAQAARIDVQPYTWDNRAQAILTHISDQNRCL